MTWREAVIAGTPGRVFRISFSGELAFELNVPTWHGLALWEAVMAAGEPLGITPYGTETMHVLRAEKGYPIIGQETDGTVTPQDLGMAWAVSTKKDFIGRRSHRRPDATRADRKQLVGLLPVDPDARLPEGAQLVAPDADLGSDPVPMLGHVTSSYRSAALGRTFALALVKGGRDRIGQRVLAPLVDGIDRGRDRRIGRVRPGEPAPRRGARRVTATGLRAHSPLEGVGAAGACPRAAVPGPGRPACRSAGRRPDGPPRRARSVPARRPSRTPRSSRTTAPATSCGSAPMSG